MKNKAMAWVVGGLILAGLSASGCDNKNKDGATAKKKPTPPPAKVTLAEAVENGYATVKVSGVNLLKISVAVTCSYKTEITITGGTLFGSNDPGAQNMMVAVSKTVVFAGSGGNNPAEPGPAVTHTVELEAYCTERWKDIPSTNTTFTVPKSQESDTAKLARCLEQHKDSIPHRTRQEAIWVLTNWDLSIEEFARKEVDEMVEKEGKSWEAFRQSLKDRLPGAKDQELDMAVQKMRQELERKGVSLKDFLRQSNLDSTVDSYREIRRQIRPILEKCGINVAGKRFFQG